MILREEIIGLKFLLLREGSKRREIESTIFWHELDTELECDDYVRKSLALEMELAVCDMRIEKIFCEIEYLRDNYLDDEDSMGNFVIL